MLYLEFWASFWKGWAEVATGKQKAIAEQPSTDSDVPAGENLNFYKNHMNGDAVHAIREEFLANMNHDLRTPLNAVIGFAQIIESEMHGEIEPQYLEYARHIQESGYDLLAKIEELLQLAEKTSNSYAEPRQINGASRKFLARARQLAVAD